ncbi:GTP-binding protein [Sphaerisporangium album]|uniref:GTP-binding protein n=1 Tax=Sphaerisporangium album TaxID=509200 RepID=A0A367FGC3_9ACTN|nr:TetM/TetW/TetO/TetS family tetracycline resistance ribosomal protection protein [Sphaerisporangium album]RCG28650.1 GTP-binding protein [Sphaerisporangium album]
MPTLNLGILAHVDAGKTSLTEQLLFAAGVIDRAGSVDDGDTQTDTLDLERARGITIKSAVVSFAIAGVTVNLIDTPGHPDFIAEVERVLSVLDGAVLVVSAVEGVQAQTRVLARALRRLRIPTLIFINKIDRRGAHPGRVLDQIRDTLTPDVVAMGAAHDLGTPAARFTTRGPGDGAFTTALADLLARHDDALLASWLKDPAAVPYARLRAALADQTRRALAHPVFAGSAVTGAGVDALTAGLVELLPAAAGDAAAPVSGRVFKVERGPAGEKIAYVRMFSGTLRTRDRPPLGERGTPAKVTAVQVFDRGTAVRRASVHAGQIGKVWGLTGVRIGDPIGATPTTPPHERHFPPPALETAVVPHHPEDKGALHTALTQLAEQDPLINLRQDDVRQELFLSLYGEVQKEVIQQTLAADYGLRADFRETTTICVERPAGTGVAVERIGEPANPFLATAGLRVEPAAPGSGVRVELDLKVESIPLYIYKSVEEFHQAVQDTVRQTLRQGLRGWQVLDCAVTMTDCGYASPETTARDLRLLTPLVLMSALRRAGTVVCEPVHRFHLEIPSATTATVLPVLARLGATTQTTATSGQVTTLEGDIRAARAHDLRRRLSALTHGEGVLELAFGHHEPVRGAPPTRRPTGPDPLNREQYLLHLRKRV